MKRPIRLNNAPLFKREKTPILKYHDVLKSEQMIQKYPEIKMFANDDDAFFICRGTRRCCDSSSYKK